jgi:Spy/CpxP family protein refolding chaperone
VKKQPLRATGLVAAGVIAGGILAGTLSSQAADDRGSNTDAAPGMAVHAHHRGPGGPGGDEDLAKALGVSEQKLRAAFREIRDDVRPTERPDGPPTASERSAHRDKFTAALAKELGLSESKVEAAFEKVQKAHAAERRDALSDRLDAAIDDGKLTKGDKASVLKAFDAGVLGGPGPR